ncbi:MbtH family NRPS accessory protein [Micromonospora sp. NPDC048999]|uniref:MbtH family protein n=1 Tax=Micromonospora sp. NPDC048999 TaxID=3155391 RepID=UPI0033C92C67
MATNPFDDDAATFHVLVNEERQFCIWPVFADVPTGWTVVRADQPRADALRYIEQTWTDMRPASLATAMDGLRR